MARAKRKRRRWSWFGIGAGTFSAVIVILLLTPYLTLPGNNDEAMVRFVRQQLAKAVSLSTTEDDYEDGSITPGQIMKGAQVMALIKEVENAWLYRGNLYFDTAHVPCILYNRQDQPILAMTYKPNQRVLSFVAVEPRLKDGRIVLDFSRNRGGGAYFWLPGYDAKFRAILRTHAEPSP